MDLIDLAQDRDGWWAVVNGVMNLRFPWNAGNILTGRGTVSFSGTNQSKKKSCYSSFRGIFSTSKDFPKDSYISGCDHLSRVIRHFRKGADSGCSSVGKVTGCIAKEFCFESWQEKGIFLFSQLSRRGCGVHPASYFPGDLAAGTWSWWFVSV